MVIGRVARRVGNLLIISNHSSGEMFLLSSVQLRAGGNAVGVGNRRFIKKA